MLLDKNWMDLWQKQNQLAKVLETNRVTERFGLVLSGQEAEMIVEERANALRTQRRWSSEPGSYRRLFTNFAIRILSTRVIMPRR